MKKLRSIIDKISSGLCAISKVVMLAIVVVVLANIIGRKLFNTPVPGTVELVSYGMLVVMALSMARTTFTGGHITVSIVTAKFPKAVQAVVGFLTLLFSVFIVGAATFICLRYIPSSMQSGQITDHYKIPFYVIYSIMSFGLVTSVLTFLFNAVSTLMSIWQKDESGGGEEAKV